MPFLLAERAHSESARSMRAVKGSLDHSLQQMFGSKKKMEPDDLLCSRNARSWTPLVGHAQGEINQAPSLKRKRASLGGIICSLVRRAHVDQLGCPSKRGKASWEGSIRWMTVA